MPFLKTVNFRGVKRNTCKSLKLSEITGGISSYFFRIRARKIPWMGEPGRLQSMGSLRVGHDWATSLSLFTLMHWRRKWQPTPVFLPGESQGRGSLVGCRLWGRTESDTTEVISSSSSSSCVILGRSLYFLGCCLVTKSCPTLCDPMAVARQPPLSMGFPRQEYWSG